MGGEGNNNSGDAEEQQHDIFYIDIPHDWDRKYNENEYYKISEEKHEGKLVYQEIRPLTPKRVVKQEDNRVDDRAINRQGNVASNGRQNSSYNNYDDYGRGGINKENIKRFYRGDFMIPNTRCQLAYYLKSFDINIERYDEVIEWLFPTEYVERYDFDQEMKNNYKKMVDKAITVMNRNPDDKKAYELLLRVKKSIKIIDPSLEGRLNEIGSVLQRIHGNGDDHHGEYKPDKEKIKRFYNGDNQIPETGKKIYYYLSYFNFQIQNYDKVIKWLFPMQNVEFKGKMKDNYEKMVKKACEIISYNSQNSKACDLLFILHGSVKIIDPSLVEKLNEADAVIGV